MQNSKLRDRNPQIGQKPKKPSSISYIGTEDNMDNDVILRMVLPGYNWFEDQIKSNMYMTNGEKKTISKKVSTHLKTKIPDDKSINPVSELTRDGDGLTKQKTPLSKRVINSTLMLLPNNSLPLKKRKIKERSEDNETEIIDITVSQIQEIKKIPNPPIQKVTPILNNNGAVVTDSLDEKVDILLTKDDEPSLFKAYTRTKNQHINPIKTFQKSTPITQSYPQNSDFLLHSRHAPMITRKVDIAASEVRTQFQYGYNLLSPSYCPHCTVYQYQQPASLPGQQCSLNHAMLPYKSYWPNYSPTTLAGYDPMIITDSRRSTTSSKLYDNYTPYAYSLPAESFPINPYNLNSRMFCNSGFVNKPTNSLLANDAGHQNCLQCLDHVPHQLFAKGGPAWDK